ncbi:alpha/beta hydrolase family protein [Flavobacterium orientale]|uniref:Alpha/beta hydrolase n=1 Tax=Flavobacterium orientale TaxID=1756020 RepID=A0A916XVS1_9FLAO|nr:alpha/beta fold hydrolase [Flavobacterium orientale]GGD15357.1 alpha/beta hydrolase [Flavobacterium orientale]
MKKSLLLLAFLYSISSFAQDITGDWKGTLKVMGTDLELNFNFAKNNEDYIGSMSVPQQKAMGIQLTSVKFENNTLDIFLEEATITYSAKLNENNELVGKFIQRGQEFDLTLTRGFTEIIKPKRPQEPKAPFNYAIEEVTFENKQDNVTLSGTLTYPKDKKSFPTVILISGSGPQDRNSEIFHHKPFWVIADYLTNNGIAVLRYDDRGVGKSTGDRKLATSNDFATDVEAAISFLKTKKQIDPKKIGLIGHSEGGMIAQIVASKDKSIAFIVLLASPGIPGNELLKEQAHRIGKAAGMTEEELVKAGKTNETIYNLVKSDLNHNDLVKQINAVMSENLKENMLFQMQSPEEKEKTLTQQTQGITVPWFRYFMRFNPSDYIEKIKCPILALNGDKDLQVIAESNLTGIAEALKKAGNKNSTTKKYPNLNHLFQESETGKIEEYETIEQTFSPEVLQDIKNWILLQK